VIILDTVSSVPRRHGKVRGLLPFRHLLENDKLLLNDLVFADNLLLLNNDLTVFRTVEVTDTIKIVKSLQRGDTVPVVERHGIVTWSPVKSFC